MSLNTKELASGALFGSFGLVYGFEAWRNLPIGEALDMGPGYFPVLLSGALIAFGVVIAGRSFVTSETGGWGVIPWRAIVMISLALIVFAAFLRELGLLPAVAVSSFLAALSSRRIGLWRALATAAGLGLFCTLIFGFLLKLSIPILGSWFGG